MESQLVQALRRTLPATTAAPAAPMDAIAVNPETSFAHDRIPPKRAGYAKYVAAAELSLPERSRRPPARAGAAASTGRRTEVRTGQIIGPSRAGVRGPWTSLLSGLDASWRGSIRPAPGRSRAPSRGSASRATPPRR